MHIVINKAHLRAQVLRPAVYVLIIYLYLVYFGIIIWNIVGLFVACVILFLFCVPYKVENDVNAVRLGVVLIGGVSVKWLIETGCETD